MQRNMSQLDYLRDSEISRTLIDIDEFVSGYEKARREGDYSMICFYLGCINGACGLIYERNHDIWKEIE